MKHVPLQVKLVVMFVLGLLLTSLSPAAILTVTTTADENNGMGSGAGASLREAITAASPGDTIQFKVTGTISLILGELNISKNLTISGPGAHLLSVSGNNSFRVFTLANSVTATISDLTLSNGNGGADNGGAVQIQATRNLTMNRCAIRSSRVDSAGYSGGGIMVEAGAVLTMTDCEISGNSCNGTGGTGNGGGVCSQGDCTLSCCTIYNNTADVGGGVYVGSGSTGINSCTIAFNTAVDDGGGLLADNYYGGAPVVNLKNSIISDNVDQNDPRGYGFGNYPDIDYCSACGTTGTINSGGYNVIRTLGDTAWTRAGTDINSNPLMNALADNGGPTRTCTVAAGSPAIDTIPPASSYNGAPAADQRLYTRIGNYDSGACEYNGSEPEIDLHGNGISIVSGDNSPSTTDHSDFGSVMVSGGTQERTFTMYNTGSGGLTLIHYWIDGSHAADFSVTAAPALSVSAGASTTITVRFDPSTIGTRSATLHFSSNDSNESHYTFAIQGSGLDQAEMAVEGNSIEIVDGDSSPSLTDHSDFGDADIATGTVSRSFTIRNSGGQGLNLGGSPRVVVSGADAASFSVAVQPAATVAVSGTTTFQVSFDPATTGLKTAEISIANDDGDENPYNFAIQGTGTSAPEMSVEGNGVEIADGDTTPASADFSDFGSAGVAGGTVSRTFTIKNSGSGDLNLTGSPRVSIGGSHSGDFSVTAQAATPVASLSGSTSFTVQFDPGASGTRTAQISIACDDGDENPYNFTVQGTGIAPEMSVEGNAVGIADGDATPSSADHSDFGDIDIASGSIVRTFTIRNSGDDTLSLGGSPRVVASGADAASFSVAVQPAATVAMSGTTIFQVSFDPATTGLKTAEISIANDDGDENPYNFAIQGTGTSAPEMSVEGNGVEIADGDTTPASADFSDFGNVVVLAGSQTRSFIIRNSGSGELTLSGSPLISLSGSAAADFSVTVQPSSPIDALGGSTSFQLSFIPSAVGIRSAVVQLASDDADENPYNFAIQGNGVLMPVVQTQPATSVGVGSATLNGIVNANGFASAVRFEYGLSAAYGSGGPASPATVAGGANTAVSLTLTGLQAESLYHYRVLALNDTGTVYGNDMTFFTGRDNQPPTVNITNPLNGATVSGQLTISAEVADDDEVREVSFWIDGGELSTQSLNRPISEGIVLLDDLAFDLSDGLALALDVDHNLLLLTRDLDWRYLAGADAGLLDLRGDSAGGMELLRDYGSEKRWLQLVQPGAERLSLSRTEPRFLELKCQQAIQGTWPLPGLGTVTGLLRSDDWLAAADSWQIAVFDIGGKARRLLACPGMLRWIVLADGTVLTVHPDGTRLWRWIEDRYRPERLGTVNQIAACAALPDLTGDTGSSQVSAVWDSGTVAPGRHSIEVLAYDSAGLTGSDRVDVEVPGVRLSLEVQRKSEKLWIIRHEYAEICLTAEVPEDTNLIAYVLERSMGGEWLTMQNIDQAGLRDGKLTVIDNGIEKNQTYHYRVRALDSQGTTIAQSLEVVI